MRSLFHNCAGNRAGVYWIDRRLHRATAAHTGTNAHRLPRNKARSDDNARA